MKKSWKSPGILFSHFSTNHVLTHCLACCRWVVLSQNWFAPIHTTVMLTVCYINRRRVSLFRHKCLRRERRKQKSKIDTRQVPKKELNRKNSSLSFRYIGTGLPGLNQYLARINVLAQGHNAVTPVRLEPMAPQSWAKHSNTEPLCYLCYTCYISNIVKMTWNVQKSKCY